MAHRLVHLAESHEVVHAFDLGWADLQNGKLIAAADESFEVLVTIDKKMRFQQNLKGRHLCVAILDVPDGNLETQEAFWRSFLQQLHLARPGEFVIVQGTNS